MRSNKIMERIFTNGNKLIVYKDGFVLLDKENIIIDASGLIFSSTFKIYDAMSAVPTEDLLGIIYDSKTPKKGRKK